MFCIYMMCLLELLWPDCAIQYLELSHWMVCVADIANFFTLIENNCNQVLNFVFYFFIERPDIKSQFTSLLYQLLLDPSDRVCFEAILCVLGKSDTGDRYFFH